MNNFKIISKYFYVTRSLTTV